jgi:D-serine deaminase-like pyridoxal phosphate-dependent protein
MILLHPISEVQSRRFTFALSRGSRAAAAAAAAAEEAEGDPFTRFAAGTSAPFPVKLQVQFVLVLRAGCMA